MRIHKVSWLAALCLTASCSLIDPDIPKVRVPAEGVSFSTTKALDADEAFRMAGNQGERYNSLGFLKMTFTGSPGINIKKISLHDLGGNMLWGDFHIPSHADTLAYAEMTVSGGDNTIDLVFDRFVTFDQTPQSICFPLPPGALDRGFSLVFYEFDRQKPGNLGRAYTFVQDLSGSAVVKRTVTVETKAIVLSEKSEAYDVGARGYYKSLFIDAGADLLDYYKTETLPFIDDLGLSADYEYFAADTKEERQIAAQTQCFDKTTPDGLGWSDMNGMLLYPDNEPRFRMMYVNGGLSRSHGLSLTKQALDNVHVFVENGGSYVGTCAGAFLASTYYGSTLRYGNSKPEEDCSFGIWPGSLSASRIPVTINEVTVDGRKYEGWGTVVTGMKVVSDKLKDYSFAVSDTLQDTWHLGGCYMPKTASNLSLNPDILLTFQYADPGKAQSRPAEYQYTRENLEKTDFPQPFYAYNASGVKTHSRNLVDSVSTFAYKASPVSGRAVLCGSHPERRKPGSRQLPYMEMMVRYAMDGNGAPTVKAALDLGRTRTMDRTSDDGDPDHARIGDRQYHHYTFTNAAALENVQFELSHSAPGTSLYLALRKEGLAWISDADYVVCNEGGSSVLNIKNLPAGTWYVSVYCASTVEARTTDPDAFPCYFKYSGNTAVLDGIAYSVSVRDR